MVPQFVDHLDVRVADLARARAFYDGFCAVLGLTERNMGERWVVYTSTDPAAPFIGIIAEPRPPSSTRIALRAASNAEVDRVTAAAQAAGAADLEPPALCPEYGDGYYASFFADPDGNRYEICCREAARVRTIARLWRGRVRKDSIEEYRRYVAQTGIAQYQRTPGNRGACILSAQAREYDDILTLSFWSSREAIVGFAGEPIERARYYPDDAQYLLDFPEYVEHFEVT